MTARDRAGTLPGTYPRRRRNVVLSLFVGAFGCLIGMLLVLLMQVFGNLFGVPWLFVIVTMAILVLAAVVLWTAFRILELGRIPSWADHAIRKADGQGVWARVGKVLTAFDRHDKGEAGEVRIWESVNQALTAPGCAMATSVTNIPGLVGDVDLLVATPVRLWVIDAKYRDLPKEALPKALRGVDEQVSAVKAWAPPGTPVLGCMVLAFAEKSYVNETYDRAGAKPIPPIKVYDRPSKLESALRKEVDQAPVLEKSVATKVWALGQPPESA